MKTAPATQNNDTSNPIFLNMGCGSNIIEDHINIDLKYSKGVDIILNLDYPLPFKSNSIQGIVLDGVFSHLKHQIKLKRELKRILKLSGRCYIRPCTRFCEYGKNRFNKRWKYHKK